MRIRISLGISFGIGMMLVAYADDRSKREFDAEQTSRLESLQEALGKKDKDASRALAKEQSNDLEEQLKEYDKFGPNQRLATSEFIAAIVTKDFVDGLAGSSKMFPGKKISTTANEYFRGAYGIDLKFDEKDKKWNAVLGSDPDKSIEKVRNLIKEKVKDDKEAKAVWDSLPESIQSEVAKNAVRSIGSGIKDAIPEDGQTGATLSSALEKKSKELGEKGGTIEKLKKQIKSASKDDKAEKNLLSGQKKAVDKIKDSDEEVSLVDFCKEFATKVDMSDAIQRRLDASKGADPCRKPLSTQLASVKKDKKLTDSDGDSPLLEVKKKKDKEEDEEADPDEDEPAYTKKEKKDKSEDSPKVSKATREALEERDAAIEQMQQNIQTLQEQNQTLQNAYNMSQACQRGMGTSKDPFGLNADNQRNEKMISSLKDEMEKVLVDNYTAAVCDQVERGKSLSTASKGILKGLGIPEGGAMTAAEQSTLKDVAQAAIDQAGNFAKKKSVRRRLQSEIEEAASKKALTRLTAEYSTLINPNTVSYLRTLSHADLVGLDGYGFGGALTQASSNPQDPSGTIYQFNILYESAMLDMKKKYGEADEYDRNADCAYGLAQTASSFGRLNRKEWARSMGPIVNRFIRTC